MPVREPDITVDDGESVGIALHGREKACPEIKHGRIPHVLSAPPQAPLARSRRSRCSGTNGRKETRGSPTRWLPAARATRPRATSGCPAYRNRTAIRTAREKPPATVKGDPPPAPSLRRYECPPLPPGPQGRGRRGPEPRQSAPWRH